MRSRLTEIGSPKILFIAGAGRSGSTVLEMVLGEVDSFVPLGEVRHLWERGALNNQSCGCGERFRDCRFWARVYEHAKSEYGLLSPEILTEIVNSVERFRHFPLYMFNGLGQSFRGKLAAASESFLSIYRSASAVTDAVVLIDSSKHMHGQILARMNEIDLYVVHLVRDSRATSYSWSRRKVYEEGSEGEIFMPRISSFFSSLEWIGDNLLAEYQRMIGSRYLRVRYEDFARNPEAEVRRILDFVGCGDSCTPISSHSTFSLGKQHSVSGNPARFSRGEVALRVDDAWRDEMPMGAKIGVTVLTFPLLWRYGYLSKNASAGA